eukprot:9253637-Pyramimonas_sp.AAC.1
MRGGMGGARSPRERSGRKKANARGCFPRTPREFYAARKIEPRGHKGILQRRKAREGHRGIHPQPANPRLGRLRRPKEDGFFLHIVDSGAFLAQAL